MPTPSTRRRALQATGLAVVSVLSGCPSGTAPGNTSTSRSTRTSTQTSTPTDAPQRTPLPTGTYADAPGGPSSYPDRPEELTRDSVLRYVEAFEATRTRNSLHTREATEVSAGASSRYDARAHGGHYAVAMGMGYANYENGAHADWGQAPAHYFVGPDLTVRTGEISGHVDDCEEVFAAEDPDRNFAAVCSGDDASYRVYNFHPETHTVSVTVEFLGEETPGTDAATTVLEREYFLGVHDAHQQGSVTYRRGVYRLTARMADGPETTYRWDLRSGTNRNEPVTVTVTPRAGIAVRRPPLRM